MILSWLLWVGDVHKLSKTCCIGNFRARIFCPSTTQVLPVTLEAAFSRIIWTTAYLCVATNRPKMHWTLLWLQSGLLVPTNHTKDVFWKIWVGVCTWLGVLKCPITSKMSLCGKFKTLKLTRYIFFLNILPLIETLAEVHVTTETG